VDRLLPLRLPASIAPVIRPLGWLLVILGAGLAFWAMGLFRRARTSVLPFKAATTMVIEGPYRFSRNPIYLGVLVGYLGVALVTGLIWPLLLVPLVQSSLRGLAIDAEEAHLRERFGEQYREYQRRVRRWL
jgi:protein-S-isoprenylcysteine O-methyltransferase Ste14